MQEVTTNKVWGGEGAQGLRGRCHFGLVGVVWCYIIPLDMVLDAHQGTPKIWGFSAMSLCIK